MQPDVLAYSQRDYGNRVGIWRLLDLVDSWGVRGSISWNVALGDHHPETTGAVPRTWVGVLLARDVQHALPVRTPEADERKVIEDSVESIARLTGQPPTGLLAPALTYTERTST